MTLLSMYRKFGSKHGCETQNGKARVNEAMNTILNGKAKANLNGTENCDEEQDRDESVSELQSKSFSEGQPDSRKRKSSPFRRVRAETVQVASVLQDNSYAAKVSLDGALFSSPSFQTIYLSTSFSESWRFFSFLFSLERCSRCVRRTCERSAEDSARPWLSARENEEETRNLPRRLDRHARRALDSFWRRRLEWRILQPAITSVTAFSVIQFPGISRISPRQPNLKTCKKVAKLFPRNFVFCAKFDDYVISGNSERKTVPSILKNVTDRGGVNHNFKPSFSGFSLAKIREVEIVRT